MIVSEEAILFTKKKQDIYTALEIVRMIPLFQRNNIYTHFLHTNSWVYSFLPNARKKKYVPKSAISFSEGIDTILIFLCGFFERPARSFQLWYMKHDRTKEKISDYLLAFHPFDYHRYVLREYQKRLKQFKLV